MFIQRQPSLAKLICAAMLLVVLASSLSEAQVTFSRDWNAGKRSLVETAQPAGDCGAIWRSVTGLCAAITKNIQHLTMCETRSLLKSMQNEEMSMENNSGSGGPIFANNHL
ncbi:adipokinetic hormone/corazonin-related peptide-like [Culex pipiens pallens]|uniref:Adipokinetic hormone 2 preprohormone n=1 Tax=Culex pipiens TaxID=7175 RepID=C8Z3D9_CULPI|nr:adipokinetic hormone/corazonin-related peptide-like [Culex pipiens pallens]CAY77167.1 adipokinetic hormone 2 preprohormone [Culex pipiens]